MRAVQIIRVQPEPMLAEADVPVPAPRDGEVLIRVHAAGVTPTELLWSPTTQNKDGSPRNRAIPGHEFSGVVAALGKDIKDFSIGDEVFGMNDWFVDGATADYCTAPATSLAHKPKCLTHAEAAAVPIGALTAWQGLNDHAKLQAWERILVHGGAGAVGTFCIQLARHRGAKVIATASTRNVGFVSRIGADQVIDYAMDAFDRIVRGVDVVFDTVGGETLRRSWSVLKPGGRLVTVAADSENTNDAREKKAFFIVEPNHKQLAEIGEMLESGQLRVFVDEEVPFSSAAAAYNRETKRSLGYGKTVIVMPVTESH
jgi:NADPH:quinone reductase-like Zn-dependent oxidoreductase